MIAASPARAEAPLQFQIKEGDVLNAFYRDGPVAAHLLLSSGRTPRVLVAFPAGNSGVGLWLKSTPHPVQWTLHSVDKAQRTDQRGRKLYGITAQLSVDSSLIVDDALLSSVRVLRDYQIERSYPSAVKSTPSNDITSIEWARPRLDEETGYVLSVRLGNGTVNAGAGQSVQFQQIDPSKPLQLKLTALSGDTPLTPLAPAQLLNARASADVLGRQALSFLSYEEKFLAGSWRFNTYFGRDTLMSLRLLMPALQPEAIERGIMSVLERLAPNGEVAHEEDIGEFAVLRHRRDDHSNDAAPIFDYAMIDDDYMLAPVVAAYCFEFAPTPQRIEGFLSRKLSSGESVGRALLRNFTWVVDSAVPFASEPHASNLIALKAGRNTGEWRDSQDGLAGGRYPYNVNAVFVPAALGAIARFNTSGLLRTSAEEQQTTKLAHAARYATVWVNKAPALFDFEIERRDALHHIERYAQTLGINPAHALGAVPTTTLHLGAIALDDQLRPIRVTHSDGGFALLFQEPSAAEVNRLVANMMRPFPTGLMTDAGLLVANPALANPTIQQRFGPTAYHGTVVWSWQQALLAAGLARQLTRTDLPDATRRQLHDAQRRLWKVIVATRNLRATELWSWRYTDGRFVPTPFGQNAGDADESNAAQLWSTVYLAIPPPAQ